MTKPSPNKKLISLKRQPIVLLISSSFLFLLIVLRLIFLQLLNYESFKKMSDENRIRLIASQPIRGKIIDKNGYVYLTDRKDDMIISGGFNIWPAELENVISNLEGVREVAVVAAPHDRWGEEPVAVVVVNDQHQVTSEKVISACRIELGSYKRPGRVIIQTEPLPRTPVGKIQRKAVREQFWEKGSARGISGA